MYQSHSSLTTCNSFRNSHSYSFSLPFYFSVSVTLFLFVAVQSLSLVRLFVTPWTAGLSFTSSQNLLKLTSIQSVMPSNHLILCRPLLLLLSVFPSIRVFSIELALLTMWPKYWSFTFSISPSSEYSGLISSGLTGLISLQSKGLLREFFFFFSL